MTQYPSDSNGQFRVGLRYGLIAAAVYLLLLLIRYLFFNDNPIVFTTTIFFSYLVIVSFFVLAASAKKKEQGGYASIKDLFGTIFVVILFAEVAYAAFNYVYLNFVDPTFFERYLQSTVDYLQRHGADTEVLNKQIEKFEDEKAASASFKTLFSSLATWIIVDSIIGILIALIMKKDLPRNHPEAGSAQFTAKNP